MNGKLIFVFGVQIVLVYGQPIFNPMAGHVGAPVAAPFGLPIPFNGIRNGYAGGGGAGFPLLSPLELNAIMEAQAKRGTFNAAFAPDNEPRGFAGFGGNNAPEGFIANLDEGFGAEGNSDFYEAPQHEEPYPSREAEEKQPEPKGRDNRGPYHKDVEERPSEEGPSRQRGGYRDEDRDGESNAQNEPASGGAYREYRGEGGASEDAGEPDGPEPNAGGSDNYRDDGPPEHYRNHASAFQEDRDQGGPADSGYEPKERPSGKQSVSGDYRDSENRRPVMGGEGYAPGVYQDDPRNGGGAYRPTPNSGLLTQGYPASSPVGGRVNRPNYGGYKVITP